MKKEFKRLIDEMRLSMAFNFIYWATKITPKYHPATVRILEGALHAFKQSD